MADKSENLAAPIEKGKRRKGIFPRIPLSKVLELTDAIFDEGHGDPVRRRAVFEKLGKSPDSSTSTYLLQAASAGYSLVIGTKDSTHLELTDLGKNISNPSKAQNKTKLIYELFFSNPIFDSIVAKYKDRPLPNDTILIDFLFRDFGLDEKDAHACWNTIKENLVAFNLIEESGNKKIILDKEHAFKNLGVNLEEVDTKTDELIKEAEPKSTSDKSISQKEEIPLEDTGRKSRIANKHQPQIIFNIQVVLPESTSPDVYDAIFSSMSTHLMGRDEE